MKSWYAVLSAVLVFIPPFAIAADDADSAARELARKTVAFARRGDPVNVSWRNVSSMGTSDAAHAQRALEAALRDAGLRVSQVTVGLEVRVTLSENATQYLMVEEARKGEERQLWIAAWPRALRPAGSATGVTLERRLVWEQDEPILDVAFPGSAMLVLSPGKLALFQRENGAWEPHGTAVLTLAKPGRDPRGRLRITGSTFRIFLPGLLCSGAIDPSLGVECRPSDEPWVLDSGSRAMLIANFTPARNYFDGRVASQTGVRKSLAPFYSAAAAEDQGRQLWLVAMLDGKTQILDAGLEPVGSIPSWGSDIVGTDARCGGGSQVLATRPGDTGETDAVLGYAVVNRAATLLTAPLDFPGPVTALWPAGGTAALAVARHLNSGKYSAYVISVACGS